MKRCDASNETVLTRISSKRTKFVADADKNLCINNVHIYEFYFVTMVESMVQTKYECDLHLNIYLTMGFIL